MSCCERHAALSRRGVLGAALGMGALLGPSMAWANDPEVWADPDVKVDSLLLTCMDFRLTGAVCKWMDGRGLAKNYDHVILAGASLGATTPKFPAWNETFWQHLGLAVKLHRIGRVIVIDHRDCGAYKVILNEDLKDDPVRELKVHSEYLRLLREQIIRRQSGLTVELGLMNLDGSVMPVV